MFLCQENNNIDRNYKKNLVSKEKNIENKIQETSTTRIHFVTIIMHKKKKIKVYGCRYS